MPAAARLGDATQHGNPLTPPPAGGCRDVFIGGQPAWRAGLDVHVCPLVSGTVPHVGGLTQPGTTTVFINGFAAARQGDTIVESGPPNTIMGGEQSVQVGP
ncbi:Zn-binding Pro-Ala-Ala-Arg (PAAR) domain-containing protein, incolved in TypeVI secretion [Halogranum amylolyticum]|uniref:Zn-binding Pro-Ala-Ala-Arg (PAAR) domain-containing protein, incolved in TypeVI secretion n=1 Tax=Halogranum amylolyticum TaxID=660520 RepID=A0A1H8WFY3_9EURY|nr:PAAR domain-containing protein [Halogranum amylolyticum]SEP26594.1 Zn-binding Pro-Ala-Ala-Arg (PAAR) domain-containing protein, incolved in TypeVI secretion [Halogranum amylolyticum]